MANDHELSIKDDEQNEALRGEGMAKEKLARNAYRGVETSRE